VIEPTDSSALDVVASMSKEQRKKLLMRIKNPFFDMRINEISTCHLVLTSVGADCDLNAINGPVQ
jgi:hypothetical protein